MAKKHAVRVTLSTGNVFRDLGFSKEESEHLLVRADLLIQVQKAITSRGLKQAAAAKTLRVTQPRVSDLLRDERFVGERIQPQFANALFEPGPQRRHPFIRHGVQPVEKPGEGLPSRVQIGS